MPNIHNFIIFISFWECTFVAKLSQASAILHQRKTLFFVTERRFFSKKNLVLGFFMEPSFSTCFFYAGSEFIEALTTDEGCIVSYHCKLCECSFTDLAARLQHLKGRRHLLTYQVQQCYRLHFFSLVLALCLSWLSGVMMGRGSMEILQCDADSGLPVLQSTEGVRASYRHFNQLPIPQLSCRSWLGRLLWWYTVFCVKGFPLQRPDWRVIYCNGFILRIPKTWRIQLSHCFFLYFFKLFWRNTIVCCVLKCC